MLTQPKVTIIIPVYNVEKYLRKCLDSLINQTYTNLEIICVNDGSPDNSLMILEEYASKDKRIIVINQENRGVSTARNRGLEIATGKYIAFVDPDDWIELECYELAVAQIENSDEIGMVSWGANIFDNRQSTQSQQNRMRNWHKATFSGTKMISSKITQRMIMGPCTHLFKASIINELTLRYEKNFKISEDVLFVCMYLAKTEKIYFINKNLYNYVLQPKSAITRYSAEKDAFYAFDKHLAAINACAEFYKSLNLNEKFYKHIFPRFFNTLLWDLNHMKKCDENVLEKLSAFVNTVDPTYFYRNELEYIHNKQFYKVEQLNIPYFTIGNYISGCKIYKYDNPKIIFNILGIKITIHYQNVFSVKNNKNHKIFNLLGVKIKFSKNQSFKERFKRLPRKIFSVYNEYKGSNRYKVINLLGIKIKHKTNIQKFIQQFIENNNKYLARNDKTQKKRLFLTTGNISLINNLTIIRQLNQKNCEDTLVILSNIHNNHFFECNKQIANIHKFKNIYTICTSNPDEVKFLLIKNNLFDYDEIFFSNQFQFTTAVMTLYPNASKILSDEGCGSKLARTMHLDYNKIEKIIMHNYLGKLDFFGLSEHNLQKIIPLDINTFKQVTSECAALYPVNLPQQTDKAVLFCGSWWEVSGLSKDEYMELQDGLIEKLLNMGYKILFKPHPRDPRNYINNPDITILNTVLPLECYNFDVVAVVSLLSSATLHCMYTNNIAGFTVTLLDKDKTNKPLESKWLDLLVKKLMEEYTTPISELLSVNPRLYTKEELKELLRLKCKKYLDSKPILSKNKEFEEFAIDNGYIMEKEEEKICQ